jgi:hypothetical protein
VCPRAGLDVVPAVQRVARRYTDRAIISVLEILPNAEARVGSPKLLLLESVLTLPLDATGHAAKDTERIMK